MRGYPRIWSGNSRRNLVIVAGTATTVLLGTLALFTQLGPIWHLFNHEAQRISSWTVRVPRAYYVRSSNSNLSMFRHDFGVPLWSAPYAHIYLSEHPAAIGRGRGPAHLGNAVAAAAESEGLSIRSKQAINTPVGQAYCYELAERSSTIIDIRCFINQGELSVFYYGAPKFQHEFYTFLTGISRD